MLKYFNLLINTCCVIDCNKLLHYYSITGWLLFKKLNSEFAPSAAIEASCICRCCTLPQ